MCLSTRDLKLPFSKWSTEQVCDWLEDIGLGQYGLLAHQWVTSGHTLLAATPHDLEKVSHAQIFLFDSYECYLGH